MSQRTIEVADSVAVELAGEQDRVLRELEERLELTISLRGNRIVLNGEEECVEAAVGVIDEVSGMVGRGRPVDASTIQALANAAASRQSMGTMLDDVVWRHRQRIVTARTPGQQRYVDAMRNNTITFGIGPAGTGKTYLAVALAVAALTRREVGRIILTRPAVEAGERLGFLPGDLAAKVDPYLRPLYDALYDLMGFEKVHRAFERNQIEVAPLAFMRGRTLNHSFIILDEAQNTTPEQMKMFLTRIGFGTKAVITGDVTQIDLGKNQMSGLIDARNVLQGIRGIGFTVFQSEDVMRHPLVQSIVNAYEQHGRRPRN